MSCTGVLVSARTLFYLDDVTSVFGGRAKRGT